MYGTDVPASEVPPPVDPNAASPAEGEAEVPPPGGEASGSGATG